MGENAAGPGVKSHLIFRSIWWTSNLLLTAAFAASMCSGVWEISVRRYLRWFSDAMIPEAAAPQQKAEALLTWMLMVLRLMLGWIADHRLRVPRFHLRANLGRASAALFTTPEIK